MKFDLLNRRELEVINRRNFQYPLAIAEKDYFLALVCQIIYHSSLKRKLIFKGGTALYHCYLDQMRFSQDLDFTSLDRSIAFKQVKNVLESYDFLNIKKKFISPVTIKIERLVYSGPLGLPNSLRIDIDCKQNVVLSGREIRYKNAWKVETKVMVMDIREICAEKIRATSDRARYRDFYDLFMILENYKLNLKKIIKLVKQKEIRKSISKASILSNWNIAKGEKTGEFQKVYYAEEVSDTKMKNMLNRLTFDKIDA